MNIVGSWYEFWHEYNSNRVPSWIRQQPYPQTVYQVLLYVEFKTCEH